MAQQVKLKAEKRTVVGRNAIKKIKAQGLVPGVIYGSQGEPIALQVEARALTNVLAHALSEHVLVELEIADGSQSTNRLALIQEVQHHPLRPELLHVDFHAVSATEKITSEVPIEAVGDALGVRTFGGLLEHSLRTLEVECFPQDLPEIVRIDVTNLNIGESLHVRDIPLPSGVESLTPADLTVVSVVASRVGEEVTETAEAPAAPEVITEKKAEAKQETPQP
ncbi:MAG TPA: 50S ribosomal protein L25/general stress protein Ctc [Chthoniobacterales bacterium]|jgi:large subunit ribosomal protein L25|nr:50S ribosomal protein L25/general stress protein Ctc [Chthoniobacterales bacterium]